jgi:copper homeostasis protein
MLEVIAETLADARAAEAGGADRIELVRDLHRDGLTPSLDLVAQIRAAVRTPMRVMLRERDGFDIDSAGIDALANAAAELQSLDVDGLVLGFTRRGVLDTGAIRALCDAAPALRVTFHRAIEHVRDVSASFDMLARFPQIDTILHSGGTGDAAVRCARFTELHALAAGRFTILAGGGMTPALLHALRLHTPIRAFHTGRAVRDAARGVAAELVHDVVRSLKVDSDS